MIEARVLRPWASRGVVLGPVWIVAAVLVVVGGRYGLHRDEWYFVEAGRHPAPAYPDQPGLVPLAAAQWYDVVQGNVWAFRLVPAAVAALVPNPRPGRHPGIDNDEADAVVSRCEIHDTRSWQARWQQLGHLG